MSASAHSRNVLIIDDEEAVRDAVYAALEAVGDFCITQANNGLSGLSLVESVRPDILMVDLVLPDIDGLQVLKALQGRPGCFRPAHIVLMTAHPDPFPLDRLRALGADALLEKPFHLHELSRALRG